MHTELEEGLGFGTLLAEISSRFVNVPADQVDGEIRGAQRRMCEFLDLDRSSLGQVSELEFEAVPLTHIHQPQEGLPLPEGLDADVQFRFTKGFWDGFWLRLRYARLWEEGGRTGQQVRVILNFPISFL